MDIAKCAGIGICESIAPDYFAVGDEGLVVGLQDSVADGDLMLLEDAVASCPTWTINLDRARTRSTSEGDPNPT